MATVLVRLDDLDGSLADELVLFGLDGDSYEIDLNTANAGILRKTLDPYVRAGRRQAVDHEGLRAVRSRGFGPWLTPGIPTRERIR